MSQATNLLRRENWTKSGPVVSHLPGEEIESLEERAAATIADPTPLGLWGFATGTWVTGTVLAGVFPASASRRRSYNLQEQIDSEAGGGAAQEKAEDILCQRSGHAR